MANPEQLKLLKAGVEGWNKWRNEQPTTKIDLVDANLNGADLLGANLFEANLSGASLQAATLSGARLIGANLVCTDLVGVDFLGADLYGANLSGANLSEAGLVGAHLSRTNLIETNFSETKIGSTIFGTNDLNLAKELETAEHLAPSIIGTDTLQLSKGKIPESFLRGCGLTDWEIESAKLYNPDLTNEEIIKIQYRIYDLRATQALQISPLFISYSHTDTVFVNQIDSSLTEKGVRFWRDIHDAKAGRLETQIDRAIRQHPTVLLVLSENSLNSDWVQHEVRKARELEKELGRDALCPIALDDSWKSSAWPARIMEQIMEYNILDFSGWEDDSTFQSKFTKLLSGLDLFYKKPTS
jgi:hypothetical protein